MFKYFLLGLVAGLALGVALAVLFNISGKAERPEGFPDSIYVDRYDEDFKDCLEKLSTAVSELSESNRSISSTIKNGVKALTDQEKIDFSGNIEKSKEMKESMDWGKILNKELSQVLIENGMTPYDAGVSAFLKEAAQKLRDLDDGYSKTLREWRQKSYSLSPDDPDYSNLRKALEADKRRFNSLYDEERKRVLEEFGSALQFLKEKN